MSDITLTASIRSNLLSLQNASKLLDITSERLSTGKKVNSALDNPSSFFAARGLNNRATDLGARKDGLGQAISLLTATDKSINSLTKLVEQAKATAQSAEEASSSGITQIASSAAAFVSATGSGVTQLSSTATIASAATSAPRIANSTITAAGVAGSLGTTLSAVFAETAAFTTSADTLTITVIDRGANTQTLTVTATDTIATLVANLEGLDGVSASFSSSTGALSISVSGGNTITFSGDSAAVVTSAFKFSDTVAIYADGVSQEFDTAGNATDAVLDAYTNAATTDILTIAVTGGASQSITLGGKSLDELVAAISAVDANVTASVTSAGVITISGTNGTEITLTNTSGSLISDLGITLSSGTTAAASGTAYTFDDGTSVATGDLLATVFDGVAVSDTLLFAVTGGGAGTTLTISATTTIQAVLDNINASDSALTATFNTSTSKIEITAAEGIVLTVTGATGTAFSDLAFSNGTTTITSGTAATYGVAGSAAEVASLQTDFQSILEQIDKLISDASYKGTNLLSGGNNFVVKFNADGTSSLTIIGLDLGVSSNTNFNFTKDASGYDFTAAGDISQALTDTAAAISSLRSIAATFGTNLGVIQTREDFTTELVNVLRSGAGKLVNANLEEESANLLALQTRQALGIQALSISNQSNQSILSLFR